MLDGVDLLRFLIGAGAILLILVLPVLLPRHDRRHEPPQTCRPKPRPHDDHRR